MGFMTRPVVDDFRPFSLDRLDDIRIRRFRDLTERPIKLREKTAAQKPTLTKQSDQIIAGLDPATQAILQKLMGKK